MLMADGPVFNVLVELKKRLNELDAQAAAIGQERRRLREAVAALEALEANGRKPHAKPIAPKAPTRTHQEKPLEIADAAAIVVREAGRALNATVITEVINRRNLLGREIKRTSVVSALDAKFHAGEMFTKPAPGMYLLVNGR